jgi:nucleotide-binding universal stress UspA family protein
MNGTAQPRIVAGVSGSRASLAALGWAADEARLRGASLHVIRAWNPIRHVAFYAGAGRATTREQEQASASEGLQAALRTVFGAIVPSWVNTELVEAVPERVLIARSAHASLLVLGVSAAAGSAGGPVVRACLTGARCPVVSVAAATSPPTSAMRAMADAVVP